MKTRYLVLLALTLLLVLVAPATAQTGADCAANAIVAPGEYGTPLADIDTREEPGFEVPVNGFLPNGATFQVLPDATRCIDGVVWYQVNSVVAYGWIPEVLNGQTLIQKFEFTPTPPVPYDVPLEQPVISNPNTPLPTVVPAANPTTLDSAFASWNWEAFIEDGYVFPPDPLALQMPQIYAGDFPTPPVDLSTVYFVQDADLNNSQLALLAQNGFVVVPGHHAQFDEAYQDYNEEWDHLKGNAKFVTTDALLHTLFLSYQNTLMFLEMSRLYGSVAGFLATGYHTAEAQYKETVGTPLEDAARKAAIYYAVPLLLIAQGQDSYTGESFGSSSAAPSQVIAQADPSIIAEAQPLVDLAMAAQGREKVSILDDYTEDFSQYKPRGYYAGSPLLESYFRAMMWLGRITFRNKSAAETQTGLLVLRALRGDPTYGDWLTVADLLDFLVGPMDDYSPKDYEPLVTTLRGDDFSLEFIGDPNNITAFQARVNELPPPRINSIPLAQRSLTPAQLADETRGFRLMGQRFIFDGYAMQQLIYPAVGTAQMSRTLPLGLDVPAALGSDSAFGLTDEAGATDYQNYTENLSALRDEVNGISANDWLQNMAGGWLWTLQPLAIRDAAATPPLMQTDAWKRKELNTFLGSYTELKHATLLYAEQPMGGLGGGGMEPPVISFSVIEPNPLVFARISIVSALLAQGLEERGFVTAEYNDPMSSIDSALRSLSILSARLAEMARKEIAGEQLTHDELYFLQESFGQTLWYIRYTVEMWITEPPENTALVADVASNAATAQALELAIGTPDLIYVITNSPYGLQVTRGAVYSYYEFTVPIDERMTDDDWRTQVANGTLPARPDWVGMFFSE